MAATHAPGDLQREGGFTLLELLIAITIVGTLVGVVAAALAIGLRTTEEAGDQINEAAWAQILASWFVGDVHSAEEVDTGASPACSGTPPGALVAAFSWTDLATDPPGETHADWWRNGEELYRTTCGADGVPTSESTVATGVGSASIACAAASCTAAWTPAEADRSYELTAARRVSP